MQGIGSLLVILGVGSFLLPLMNLEFAFLGWIDNWGPAAGTGIRVGMIVIGAALWFFGRGQGEAAED